MPTYGIAAETMAVMKQLPMLATAMAYNAHVLGVEIIVKTLSGFVSSLSWLSLRKRHLMFDLFVLPCLCGPFRTSKTARMGCAYWLQVSSSTGS